ncbi:hypothetical protein PYCC9005_000777 [Savitreella phatthalungensis]
MAKTGRAKCVGPICKAAEDGPKQIAKGELRLGTWVFIESVGSGSYKWRHLFCATDTVVANMLKEFRQNSPHDDWEESLDGFDELDSDSQAVVRRILEHGKVPDELKPVDERPPAAERKQAAAAKSAATRALNAARSEWLRDEKERIEALMNTYQEQYERGEISFIPPRPDPGVFPGDTKAEEDSMSDALPPLESPGKQTQRQSKHETGVIDSDLHEMPHATRERSSKKQRDKTTTSRSSKHSNVTKSTPARQKRSKKQNTEYTETTDESDLDDDSSFVSDQSSSEENGDIVFDHHSESKNRPRRQVATTRKQSVTQQKGKRRRSGEAEHSADPLVKSESRRSTSSKRHKERGSSMTESDKVKAEPEPDDLSDARAVRRSKRHSKRATD